MIATDSDSMPSLPLNGTDYDLMPRTPGPWNETGKFDKYFSAKPGESD